MKIAGVIVAGGRSSRMGFEKAFALLKGRTILSHVSSRIATQVTALVINANGDASRFKELGFTVIPDRLTDIDTPLAGIHAAIAFAREHGFDAALTVPSDTPFMPRDLVPRLQAEKSLPAIAASGDQRHFLTGLWPHNLLERLEIAIEQDRIFRVKDWALTSGSAAATWDVDPFDPFFNVNTPIDLAEAERIAAEFAP
ncbi:molybdenum cofactor guanylyltransferase [Aestuariivirga sp.]|uniref:molybdenum cofactor guanylyltransferase n=1 Tax=Aestuariivirga sp. TaxID=2650926 RepID=UPI0035934E98